MPPPWMTPLYQPISVSMGGYTVLTNVGATYDATNQSRGLGHALIDFTGVASLDWRLACNKIGSGTQDWQLWNETDGIEIGVISDSGAVGNKLLNTTLNPGLSGVKLVRVRVKSSVAADDPVYYGSSLLLT